MNEPSTVTYTTAEILKRIEDKMDSNHKELSQKIDKQSEKIGSIEVELTEVKTELKGMNKRLDSQEFINRSVAIGVIVALTSGAIKLFFPNFPNLPH
ncbi:hypothetical protein cce_3902 [Crocosphaera subtropica ATCC 51142]|uniref:Uncharacterized protein n=1 Tax=Crocosphaera subtropica (strain ATCC 51142 / BH68) TaxID=43989 RepID=B1WPT5_CROS5|nr:hypothetical protein [Crocosphaera subtropica]ACB53250.1 hypothetical protein cce_3902 [Crocosphaera subtropica ATCC 51142]